MDMSDFENHEFRWNWQQIAGFALIMVAILTGLGWAGGSLTPWEDSVPKGVTPAITEGSASATGSQGFVQGQSPTSVLGAHLITITPDGIEPAAISTSHGHFILAYENRSGLDNLSLQLTLRDSAVHQLPMTRLKTLWTGEFKLDKGIYELRESSHPEWVCTLTVR
jgi:hypothetical protein